MVLEEVGDLDNLKKQLEDNGQKVTEVSIVFFDLSSSCTGYTLAKVNFENKTARFINSGAIWFSDDWKNQDKYHYLFTAIVNYFNIIGKIDLCVCEAYMINQKKLMGSQVGPELHGAVQVALSEIGVKYYNILPQSWRNAIGIKANTTIGPSGRKERDFKTPTKEFVLKHIPNIPSHIQSNITVNQRTTPSDVYDSLGVAMGFLTKLGITKWDFKDIKIQEPIDMD